jgi:hypothetical protein
MTRARRACPVRATQMALRACPVRAMLQIRLGLTELST